MQYAVFNLAKLFVSETGLCRMYRCPWLLQILCIWISYGFVEVIV